MHQKSNLESTTKPPILTIVDQCLVHVWRGRTTYLEAKAALSLTRKAVRTLKSPLGLLVIIEEGSELPDKKTQKVLQEVGRSLEPIGQGCALVYEGTGFRAAAVRAVALSMQLVVKQNYPTRVMSNVPQAVMWLEQRLSLPPSSLAIQVRDLRSGMASISSPL